MFERIKYAWANFQLERGFRKMEDLRIKGLRSSDKIIRGFELNGIGMEFLRMNISEKKSFNPRICKELERIAMNDPELDLRSQADTLLKQIAG
jgi:hypothetical protein